MLYYIVFFIIMAFFGIFINAMNILIYKPNQFYLSPTLIYSGCFMASAMFPAHEIIHLIVYKHFNPYTFIAGIFLMIIFAILLRLQVGISSKSWMKRMIPHHSTALTTTTQLLKNNPNLDEFSRRLAEEIIQTQKKEIEMMKRYLNKN